MNGYLVIGVFTLILAATLYWLQGRQATIDAPIKKKDPEKVIEVVKARDWVVEDEKDESTPVKAELETEEASPEEIEATAPVDVEPETVVEEAVEEKDIAMLSGVGPKYRSLLKEAGYTTINQIATSESQTLLENLLKANDRASITKRPPTLVVVEKWIELAKTQLA